MHQQPVELAQIPILIRTVPKTMLAQVDTVQKILPCRMVRARIRPLAIPIAVTRRAASYLSFNMAS